MSKTVLYGLVMFSLLFFVACGGGAPSTDTPANPAPTEPENPEDPESPTEEPTDPEQPTDPTPPTILGNNSAILTGPTIGSGEVSNDRLRKEIGLTLTNPNPNFSLGKAYAVTEEVEYTDLAVHWIIPVTNDSDQMYCFVRLGTILYKDTGGNILSEDDGSYVTGGSEGEDDGFYGSSCLAAGEQGYFTGIETPTGYDEVASLEIENITESDFGHVVSKTRVIPQDYVIEDRAFSQDISVAVTNEGPSTVELIGDEIILLAEDGTPMWWDFIGEIRQDDWNGVLSKGQSNSMTGTLFYEGNVNKIFTSTSYHRPDSNSKAEQEENAQLYNLASQGLISRDQLREQLWDARNARIEADLQQLEQSATE